MLPQRPRQLDRYTRYRPVDSEEYKKGVDAAIYSVRSGVTVECPHHTDSGRYLRWTLGYTDELLRISRHLWFNRSLLRYQPHYSKCINLSSTNTQG